ncbi:hypothetical protein OPV22_024471 [Ensete ventricosum]|uniref:Uncharacterized protein n=1 Tax=Ensete ventricosum TaxID=4639 RepID=A0AAV8Q9U9_ENSVE|nr:hypothetical protein OPV22_024471 [Ensete ventricosum]RWW24679.1 hypothetical protein GW17_00011018 [Ensete ventricosum]RZR86696.1 hypothetical protein BHM03_00013931 [Ensete ventricosum]
MRKHGDNVIDAASFGVVLAFKINLLDVPATVTVFRISKTVEDGAARVVERWQHVAPKLDRDIFNRVMATATTG